ncbi:MAG: class II aldolase/adducin family protein [Terracidiphilus sp.]
MLLQSLREEVLDANLELVRRGLVLYTFGNLSAIDRAQGLVAIKPSGVAYDKLTHFQQIGAVAHTHSECATAWAQAKREIPCFGTTHADSFHGPIPVTAELSEQQIAGDYERETGVAIVQRFYTLDPETIPAALVAGHGPFCWGANAAEAAHNAAILEFVARMACQTLALNPQAKPLQTPLHDKHFLRKHGSAATYGQADAPSDSTVLE